MKHIKLFETTSAYNNWLNSDNYITPYIVKDKEQDKVFYQKKILLPYDSEIEYLEATGTQHINTNLICSGEYRFKIKFMCNSLRSPEDGNSASIFGSRTSATIKDYQLSTFKNGCFGYYGLHTNLGINSLNTEYIVEFIEDKLFINNDKRLNNLNTSFTTSSPLFLFALYQSSNNNICEHFIGRIYYFKIYDENNNIILDMIPVRKNGIGYMFDKVTNQLFENSGTSNFILGLDK